MGVKNDRTVGWISFFIESWVAMLLYYPTYISCRGKKFKFRVVQQRKQRDGERRGKVKASLIKITFYVTTISEIFTYPTYLIE